MRSASVTDDAPNLCCLLKREKDGLFGLIEPRTTSSWASGLKPHHLWRSTSAPWLCVPSHLKHNRRGYQSHPTIDQKHVNPDAIRCGGDTLCGCAVAARLILVNAAKCS